MNQELQTPVAEHPIDDSSDPIFVRSAQLRTEGERELNENKHNWRNAELMYNNCFRGEDDPVEQNNPILLKETIDRVSIILDENDFVLRMPGSTMEEQQILRDMITQIKGTSGLTQARRDDRRGNFGQLLFGSALYSFGRSDRQDTPIIFQNVRLTQAYFSHNALMLRAANGFSGATEGLLLFERTYDQEIEIYGEKVRKADMGRIPVLHNFDDVQRVDFDEDEKRIQLTEDALYFNIMKGIYYIFVGATATIVKAFDDNDPKLPNYPFKINGKNEMPIILRRTFPITDSLYAKGFYDFYGKIARNSAWRKSRARQAVDRNINPPTFIKMDSKSFAEFQNQVDIQSGARMIGEDSYVNIGLEDEVVVGDYRTPPLTNEFERLKQDDLEDVTQSGIAIQDINQPISKKATAVSFEEKNKDRLPAIITMLNAQEDKFTNEVIIDFIRKYVSKNNKTPVSTSLKIKLDTTPADMEQAQEIAATQGIPLDQAIGQTTKEIDGDGLVTFGDVAEMLKTKHKHVTVEEDFSAWGDIGFKFSKLEKKLEVSAGTPMQAEVQQEMLALLGSNVLSQNLQQAAPAQGPGKIKAPDLSRSPQRLSAGQTL